MLGNSHLGRFALVTVARVANAEDLEDFACVIRLWVTPVYVDELDDTSLKLPRIATINVEVSWPAGPKDQPFPYERRQKAEYSLDIFVSN